MDFLNLHASPSSQLWMEVMYLFRASVFTFSKYLSTSAKFSLLFSLMISPPSPRS
ncbi:hypothetical protein V512_013675 [Mesotoga sp. Brook.08.105.5.1]|nr:hypothetical protein V512_013675 [Mesotoga sp. Brook.08.105.5.1]RAO97274.1 hypothetical protein M388_00480 [Mesotoga sp. Brook.08.YT.4.2.5.4.]